LKKGMTWLSLKARHSECGGKIKRADLSPGVSTGAFVESGDRGDNGEHVETMSPLAYPTWPSLLKGMNLTFLLLKQETWLQWHTAAAAWWRR
jgi:hypothetical protein